MIYGSFPGVTRLKLLEAITWERETHTGKSAGEINEQLPAAVALPVQDS